MQFYFGKCAISVGRFKINENNSKIVLISFKDALRAQVPQEVKN